MIRRAQNDRLYWKNARVVRVNACGIQKWHRSGVKETDGTEHIRVYRSFHGARAGEGILWREIPAALASPSELTWRGIHACRNTRQMLRVHPRNYLRLAASRLPYRRLEGIKSHSRLGIMAEKGVLEKWHSDLAITARNNIDNGGRIARTICTMKDAEWKCWEAW